MREFTVIGNFKWAGPGKIVSIVCYLGYAQTGEVPVVGHNSILPKEHGAKFFNLPIVRYLNKEVGAVATWDSSIHDSTCLNTVTPGNILLKLKEGFYAKLNATKCLNLYISSMLNFEFSLPKCKVFCTYTQGFLYSS